MNGRRYTVDIDRLVLTDLDLTLAQAEQVRSHLTGELQTKLAERRWTGAEAIDLERADLPVDTPSETQGHRRLAGALARRIAQALPGTSDIPPRR